MHPIIKSIREELKNNADEQTKKSFQRFFKEAVKYYGVKSAIVGQIAKRSWKEVKPLGKPEIFLLCEELYASDYCEEAFIVSYWVPHLGSEFEVKDLAVFQDWIDKYINNWAKCDGFCNHTLGTFFEKYPEQISELKKWAKSKNRWMRRSAAVSLIVPAKRGRFLEEVFELADLLLEDRDDMVQKGYGWLLKEASRQHEREVFEYVMQNKTKMPRTALRYAIELMPKNLKEKAMKK
jgi:3-methyladenine DNA glycosylase AlkD